MPSMELQHESFLVKRTDLRKEPHSYHFPFLSGKSGDQDLHGEHLSADSHFLLFFPPNSVATLRGSCGRC